MKIYTKKGDKGQTSILGGIKLPKHHLRIEAYGTIDELNAHVGLLRDQEVKMAIKTDLISIQEVLFSIGSHLATDKNQTNIQLPLIEEKHIDFLEKKIDAMEENLPAMTNFLLPGGHPSVSQCHVTRCVSRRAERLTSAFSQNDSVEPVILKYMNRLSDYFFVLSRQIAQDHSIIEVPWKGNS